MNRPRESDLARVLMLVSVIVAIDTMLFATLAPLLPRLADSLDLSKTRSGLLVGSYALGALVGGVPGGLLSARVGPKKAVIAALTAMAIASVGFATASGFWPLFSTRFLQGAASAVTWAGALAWLVAEAPASERGAYLGKAIASAVAGAFLGPAVGVAAAYFGRPITFVVIGCLAVALLVVAMRTAAPTTASRSGDLRRALRVRGIGAGITLMAFASSVAGVLSVLVPLHLAANGWPITAIGAVFLGGFAVEFLIAPFAGRTADRRGVSLPSALLLLTVASLAWGLALADWDWVYVGLAILMSATAAGLFTPAFATVAGAADAAGISQAIGFGYLNAAWALGGVAGPAAGGAIASTVGDAYAFGLCGTGASLLAVVVLYRRRPSLVTVART